MTAAATSRSKSELGLEGGSRRSSASGPSVKGKMNALNPTFGMTSNAEATSSQSPSVTAATVASHDRKGSRDTLRLSTKNHKSSDRLHRLGAASGSTSHLSTKRSKSQTHLATQQAPASKSKRDSASGTKNSRQQSRDGGDEEVDEEGWTSASAAGTPDQSLQASPKGSDDEDEDEDGGVVLQMRGKKKADVSVHTKPPPQEANSTAPNDNRSSAAYIAENQELLDDPRTATALPHLTHASRTDSEATLGRGSDHGEDKQQAVVYPQDAQAADNEAYLAPLGQPKSRPHASQPSQQMPTSSSSSRTLTDSSGPDVFYASGRGVSSASIASRMSSRSRTTSLLPQIQAAAPPMLSTHQALAGTLGALHESGADTMHISKSPSSTSLGLRGDSYSSWQGRRRGTSISSQSSSLTLPIFQDAAHSARAGAGGDRLDDTTVVSGTHTVTGTSGSASMLAPGIWEGRRRQGGNGHNSLTGLDAAKVAASLRHARDVLDHAQGARFGVNGVGGSSKGGSAGMVHVAMDARYNKPVISTFAKGLERKWSPQAVPVGARSVYAVGYTKMQRQQNKSSKPPPTMKNNSSTSRDTVNHIRYVAKFGMGGPPIAQTLLNEALLAPSFDGDEFEASWGPALANAAGLGSRGATARMGGDMSSSSTNFREDGIPLPDPAMAFTGSAAVNGPNATPVHFIHGLTTISPDPFPLDPADAPSLALDEHGQQQQYHGDLMADPSTLRAIALTSQVLSTHRSHTMTRRYFDPMREGLSRLAALKSGMTVGDATGSGGVLTSDHRHNPNCGHAGGMASPSTAHGASLLSGRRQNASGRSGSGSLHSGRGSSSTTTNPSSSSVYPSFGEAAENPVQSLRRVWSGKGGLISGGGSGSGRSAR